MTLQKPSLLSSIQKSKEAAAVVCAILFYRGSFNNYVDRILTFFDHPHLRGQFLYPEREQKQTFFDPFPPHLVHIVIE